ncbi:hypothetical protein FISHEDRAFT_72309 [Fistulina hepatica ATCC 64428]|uniref:Uncharacterized protein n=1 Tax=Fistulina hepatica ATCC 64428 TaxID=1128425 RepID=A0A0D7AH70_9AGAR|nr:hypothetical protein FISHEDRAFT_72309 [Fistulina hepatica ATCC 64428]
MASTGSGFFEGSFPRFLGHSAEPSPAARLYTGPARLDGEPIRSWTELARSPFSPQALRDLQLRFQRGCDDAPTSLKSRFLASHIAWLAHDLSKCDDLLYPVDFFYSDAISLIDLPAGAGDPEDVKNAYPLQEQYLEVLKYSIQNQLALWDRLTHGMSFAVLLNASPTLRAPGGHAAALEGLEQAVFVTPRFMDCVSHAEHAPLRCAVDSISYTFGSPIKRAYSVALQNLATQESTKTWAPGGACAFMPLSVWQDNRYKIPPAIQPRWQLTYVEDGAIFPPPPKNDDESIPRGRDCYALKVKQLSRENSSLQAEVHRLQRLGIPRVYHSVDELRLQVERLQDEVCQLQTTNEQLVTVLECAQRELKASQDGGLPTFRRPFVLSEVVTTLAVQGDAASVPREAFNGVINTCKELEGQMVHLQAMLECEKEASAGCRTQADQWAQRIEAFHEFASCRPAGPEAQQPSSLTALPSVHPSEWGSVVGHCTFAFVRGSNLHHILPTIQSVVQSASPANWCEFLGARFPPQDARIMPYLVLAMGMDVLSGSLPTHAEVALDILAVSMPSTSTPTVTALSAPRMRPPLDQSNQTRPKTQQKVRSGAAAERREALDEAVTDWISRIHAEAEQLGEKFHLQGRWFLDKLYYGGQDLIHSRPSVRSTESVRPGKPAYSTIPPLHLVMHCRAPPHSCLVAARTPACT